MCFLDPRCRCLLKKFVTVQLLHRLRPDHLDHRRSAREAGRAQPGRRLLELAKEATNPSFVVVDARAANVLGRLGGYHDTPGFVDFLTKVLAKLPAELKVASAAIALNPTIVE